MPPAVSREEMIVDATRRVFAEKGRALTMDDVAQAAGVGRRTLFRYFSTRAELLQHITSVDMNRWAARAREIEIPSGSVASVIRLLFGRAHDIHARAGEGLWAIATTPSDDSDLGDVADLRRHIRSEYMPVLAQLIWDRGGGDGPVPEVIIDCYALLESIYFHRSHNMDWNATSDIAEICSTLFSAALDSALHEQSAVAKQ